VRKSSFAEAKKFFFDRQRVLDMADKATVKRLSRIGAYVMTAARQSLKTRRGSSDPGTPPHSHLGLVKRLLVFKYDPGSRSVVIGPELVDRPKFYGGMSVPFLLEKGGTFVRDKKRASGRVVRQTVTYPARPFMGPARDKAFADIAKKDAQ